MARKNNETGGTGELPHVSVSGERVWIYATYHAHLFHYRMPETVAIAAVSPLIPSPLTVKMALIAALARYGDIDGAKELADYLPHLNRDPDSNTEAVYLIPPPGVVTFKAFMRYTRPPAPPKKGDTGDGRNSNTGGDYSVSPHIREYALWQGDLGVLVHCPVEARELVEKALWNVTYLGAKDSQVSCAGVGAPDNLDELLAQAIKEIRDPAELGGVTGPVFRFADFASGRSPELRNLIPFSRRTDAKGNDYRLAFYMLPGELRGSGRAKIFQRRP